MPLTPGAAAHQHRILVCLDRFGHSDACLPHAVAIAKTLGSAISLIYVMQPEVGPRAIDALGWEISRQEALRYLERIEKEAATLLGRPVDVRLEQGRIAERIVDVAKETGADLIVLGRAGDDVGAQSSFGSTAQRVLGLAQKSILIAHSPSETALRRCILVPLDGSLRAESALLLAAQIARTTGAELLLIHVVREPLSTALLSVAQDMALARTLAGRLESNANTYLERLRGQVRQTDPTLIVRTIVARHTNECQCLAAIAEREHGTLVVLSAHGAACDAAQSVGSVAAYFVAHSRSPLLVVQDLPPHDRPNVQDGRSPSSLRASYAGDATTHSLRE
jgi:nucleotide-binding universal stress UspA family protein